MNNSNHNAVVNAVDALPLLLLLRLLPIKVTSTSAASAIAIYGLDLCISATGSLMRTQTDTHTHTHTHMWSILNLFAIYFISLACGMRRTNGQRDRQRDRKMHGNVSLLLLLLCTNVSCICICYRVAKVSTLNCSQGNNDTAKRKMLTCQTIFQHTTAKRVKFPIPSLY